MAHGPLEFAEWRFRLLGVVNIIWLYAAMGCIKSKNKQPIVVKTGLTRQPSGSPQSPTVQPEIVQATATVTRTTVVGGTLANNRPAPLNIVPNDPPSDRKSLGSPRDTSIKNFTIEPKKIEPPRSPDEILNERTIEMNPIQIPRISVLQL